MLVPSKYGRGTLLAPGGIRGAIEHLENKERANDFMIKRLGRNLGGARIIPTSFVTEYEVRDGVRVPYGADVPSSGRPDEMIYKHKRLHYPMVPSLSQYIEAMPAVINRNRARGGKREILRRAFSDIDEIFGSDEQARRRFLDEAYRNLSKNFRTEKGRLSYLDDIMENMRILHNKGRIAHGDLHGENIRIYRGKPYFEDFGKYVDLQEAAMKPAVLDRTSKREIVEGIGEDVLRVANNFRNIVPREAVEKRINRYIEGLDYPERIKQGVREYVRDHPWYLDYVSFMNGFPNI